jgi:hypothetical protein
MANGSAFSRGKVPTELNLFDWAKEGRKRCRRDFVYPWIMTVLKTVLQ